MGERLLCKQEVTGSIPVGSTTLRSSSFGWQASRRSLDEGVSAEASAKADRLRPSSGAAERRKLGRRLIYSFSCFLFFEIVNRFVAVVDPRR